MSPSRPSRALRPGGVWPITIVLLLTGCAAPPAPQLKTLELGKSHHAEIAAETPARFGLELAEGEAARLEVEQAEVDVEATFHGPRGEELLRFDSPIDRRAPERVCIVAAESGRHTIQLSPFQGAHGATAVRLVHRAVATAADHSCAEAARLFMSCERRRLAAPPSETLAGDYETASELWRAGGEPFFAAVAASEAGNARLELNLPESAVASFERALALARTSGNQALEIQVLNRLGLALLDLGGLDRAEAVLAEALEKARAAQLLEEEASTLNNLALVDETVGETHRAIERYREALPIWLATGLASQRAQTLKNLADAYGLLDHHDEALDLLHEALDLARQSGNLDRQAGIQLSLGWMHYLRGKPQEALAPTREALELWRSRGDRNGEVAALDRLGSVLGATGALDDAAEAYRRSLELSEQAGNAKDAAATRANLGCLALERGRLDDALSQLRSVRESFAELHDPKAMAQIEFCLARTHRQLGDLDAALAHTEAALAQVGDLRATARRRGGRYRPIWLWQDYAELQVELLLARYREHHDPTDLARAFAAGDLARARNLFELVLESQVGVRAQAPAALLERERTVQHQLNTAEAARRRLLEGGDEGTGGGETEAGEDQLAAVERRLGALSLELEEARAAIRAADPRFAELAEPRPLSVGELQKLLDTRTAVLSYSLGAEQSHLLVITRTSLEAWDLPPRARLETHAQTLYRAIGANRSNPAQPELAARALAKLLLPAGAIPAETERLMIIADGLLHYVPFAVLPSPRVREPREEERLLVDDFELQHLPSASVLAALERRDKERASAPKTLAVFADAVFSADDERLQAQPASAPPPQGSERSGALGAERLPDGPLPRLPATRTEALTLLEKVAPELRLGRLGFEATKQAVLGADLAQYRFLHFATHAQIDERFPELSGLVLSRLDRTGQPLDGDLYLHEIYGLNLAADLVVLSGCQTALGQRVRGDGLLSLTRGFLYAGSSRLLVSLWSVNDEATAALMSELYAGMLERGEHPAAALAAAQRAVRADPRWRAPYYWAAFVLQGDGR